MKLKIPISILAVVLVVALIAFSRAGREPFSAAEDFPRGALVYVEISDLPALLRLWNESTFRKKYTTSANFGNFATRHLGLKLAGRWREFNDATGFPIDAGVLSGLTENRAAFALYDIGKLEFVFIAPVSSEIFAATKFARDRDNFVEETLADQTIVYRARVEADRGRQNQELIFTHVNGRFVLATSEKLLSQTLKNMSGDNTKNRLSDEPSFRLLSEKTQPHTATVWVDQMALNKDYYFKRYWLMPETENLKNIRAGIFDLEIGEKKLVERRRFLLERIVDSRPIEPSAAEALLSRLPADIPFYKLRSADAKTIDEAIENTIFSRRPEAKTKQKPGRRRFSSSSEDDYPYYNYNFLGEKFDEAIDVEDETETTERRELDVDFSKSLPAVRPQAVLTLSRPEILPAPLFVEFRRAAIFRLADPAAFDRRAFESAIEKSLTDRVMISSPNANPGWETKTEKGRSRRELKLPMLGWNVFYLVRGNELILTDSDDLLTKILAVETPPSENSLSETLSSENPSPAEKSSSAFDKLTTLNFEQKESAYDEVFALLPEKNAADAFFTTDIKSLLDSLSEIKKITIKEHHSPNMLNEEITIDLK